MVDFLEGVRTGTAPIPLADLQNVTASTLAIVESLRTGRSVQIMS
jgi:hypothetical protein